MMTVLLCLLGIVVLMYLRPKVEARLIRALEQDDQRREARRDRG